MRLFRKRKNEVSTAPTRLVMQIGEAIELRQRKAANYLSRKTQYWNRGSKVIALALFCLLFGGCCLYLFIKAIIHF